MARRVVLIQGHPDPAGGHLCHALADAYAAGAAAAGHELRRIEVSRIDFPLLRTAREFEEGSPPSGIAEAQEAVRWADHLVLVYPLWLGTMPALLKGFLEQLFRPAFTVDRAEGRWPRRNLAGRTARVVVTMGMPALVYRFWFLAHGLHNLERNILRFVGIAPVRSTLIGAVGSMDEARAGRWLARLEDLGRRGR